MYPEFSEFPQDQDRLSLTCTTYTLDEFKKKYGKFYEIYKSKSVGKFVADAFKVIEKAQYNNLFDKKVARNQVLDEVMGLSEVQVKIGSRLGPTTYG